MDPKKEEWMQFCNCLSASDPYTRYIVSVEKCHKFMCYQSFKKIEKRGCEKLLLKHSSEYFYIENFKSVMKEFQSEGGTVTKHPNPEYDN